MRALIVEPERVFVPTLTLLLGQVGLYVECAIPNLDIATLLRVQPNFVLCDGDFLTSDPVAAARMIVGALPLATVCMYLDTEHCFGKAEALREAGAAGVLSKSAPSDEFTAAIAELVELGSYVDRRCIAHQPR